MTEQFISSLHIQKLGHTLEEIRVRALNSILSKLDHGFIQNHDFTRCLELLRKLFDWFHFESFSEEDKVLNLLLRILNSEIGISIINHIGTVALIRDLNQIKTTINQRFHHLIDDIIRVVESAYGASNVPPLVSDLPLSYRSGQIESERLSSHRSHTFSNQNERTYPLSLDFQTTKTARDTPGTTATPITGYERKSTSRIDLEAGVTVCESRSSTSSASLKDTFYKSVPYVTLTWQPLVKSDLHVLNSVEESLTNPPQPSVLLHSCEFFCNVMLQDFPAEVFLQRPAILLLFYEMIKSCPSTRITNAALICLNKLSENLLTRIRYYSDPCTFHLKQGTSLMSEPEVEGECIESDSQNKFNLNIPEDSESESEDTSSLQYNQLSLPQYCMQTFICVLTYISEKPQSFRDSVNRKKTQSGINTSLQLVDKLVALTIVCIKPSVWDGLKDGCLCELARQLTVLLDKLGGVLEQFRLMVVATDMEYFDRMTQLHLLHSISWLLSELVPITKADLIIPRNLKFSLSSSLLDASFGRLYPAAHESLIQFVNTFKGHQETESLTKYKDVQEVCAAMSKAVKFLKHSSNCHVAETLRILYDSLPSLEFHKNLNVINAFLKLCVKNQAAYLSDEVIQKLIGDILLTFLSHSNEDVRKETYFLCHKLIVNVLGLNHAKHIGDNEAGSQVIFFFRSDVFVEIAAHGLTAECLQIQTNAEDILIHILKCKFVVSESIWRKLMRALMPAMPILQCHVDRITPLGKALIKMMDPDVSPSLFMSPLDVIKGNLRMLFNKEITIRNEAVSRLCWLLTTEEDSYSKIPKIKSLQDCGLSNIFQIEHPIDLTKTRSSHHFYQASSLQQVLELLSSKVVEPSIRRSALTQISVMLEDHFLHQAFLEQNGLNLVLDILQNSVLESQYHNYPDSVIPVITILKSLCLHNTVIRQELAINTNLFFNILRALFLYCTDKRMQHDGALLCCLLLFNDHVIYNTSVRDPVGFSLPHIVVEKLYIPFKCHTHWKTSRHSKASLTDLLMSDSWCKSTLRMYWNIEWYGGISQIISWLNAPNIAALSPEQLAEFSSDLRLTKDDLAALKASSVLHCCQKYLFDVQNATTHQSVIEAIRGLAGYVALWLLANKSGNYVDDSLLNLPWDISFSRFLSAPPASTEDQDLLAELLRFLSIMLKLFKNSGKPCWVIGLLQDSTNYLPRLLQIDMKGENRSISLELLALIADCSTLEQHILDIGTLSGVTHHEESKTKAKQKSWIPVVQIITENLKFSDAEQFYNLAYLGKLLSCLVQITSNLGWTETRSLSTELHKIFSQLIEALSELLTAFHYGKGAEAASSFMGLSVTRNALLTMNHVLSEMQTSYKKNWEPYWVCDTVCCATLLSLYSLWSCRDVVVRAATLQLLAGLATSSRGATVIVENVRQRYGGVWETALSILIDHYEASVVREQAAVLLTNLCSHVNMSSTQVALPLCHAPLTGNKDMGPMDTVLVLLREYNFYEELDVLLACLHYESTFETNPSTVLKKPQQNSAPTTVRSYVATSSGSASSISSGVSVYTTPSLVKSVANFVSNLLYLAPEPITQAIAEHNLVRSFFGCLTSPSLDITDSRQFLLYTDILEMCSAVCSLLTRTVLVNPICRTMALHTRDCLHALIYLLNPELYNIHLPQFLYLRNQLWCEIFRFLTALIDTDSEKRAKDAGEPAQDTYNIVSSLLAECGYESFIKSLCESMESKTGGLQKSALLSLTSILSLEVHSAISESSKSAFSLDSLLDETKTPRESHSKIIDIENMDPSKQSNMKIASMTTSCDCKRQSLAETYQNTLKAQNIPKKKDSRCKKCIKINTNKKQVFRTDSSYVSKLNLQQNIMVGADLCKILLRLYELNNLENIKDNKRKGVIIGALSSLLNRSTEAKKCALDEGLLSSVINHLRQLHVELSLHSADSLRKLSDKKKVCPILKEIDSLFGLLNNFMIGDEIAKNAASGLGLADLTHKFWLWFNLDRPMLINVLKMLCTFTTFCEQASHSLILTNPAAGSGPRKIATNLSLLTVLINLIVKEMDLVSRSHDIVVLRLSFHILQNVCAVLECRNILAKSNLLQCLNRLHPSITKRQRPWENLELVWLEFLQTFTFYGEGQLYITKYNEALDLVMTLAASSKPANRIAALSVLRNVAFHHTNRLKLLTSVEFIQLLHTKLANGTSEEKYITVSIIWALVANSQRSKIVIKCAGLDTKIQDIIKQYEMQGVDDKSYQMMLYVYGLLKDGDR